MKLRNKKTGYVGDFGIECIKERGDYVKVVANDVPYYEIKKECGNLYYYDTLAEFNEEWEDYKPVDPLIKDEEIRKAVRAWFKVAVTHESEGIKKVFYDADEWALKFSEVGLATIQLNQPLGLGLEDKEYTIEELCGEEEE